MLHGKVYNLTPYIPYHPGGLGTIMLAAGRDASALFTEYHTWVNGESMLKKCCIGKITEALPIHTSTCSIASISKNSDLYRFTFTLPVECTVRQIQPGQHVFVQAMINGRCIERPYTPVTSGRDVMELVIKLYPKGTMSSYFSTLTVGDEVIINGPFGNIHWTETRELSVSPVISVKSKHMVMIVSGTGVNPCLAMLKSIFDDTTDATKQDVIITLLCCNKNQDYIIEPEFLEFLAVQYTDFFTVHHVLSDDTQAVASGSSHFYCGNRLQEETVTQLLPHVEKSSPVLLCGSLEFEKSVKAMLHSIGYTQSYSFM